MSLYSDLSREELKANEQFVARTVFPLVYDRPQGVSIEGSGCFYKSKNKIFIITAAHILEGIRVEDIGIPLMPVADVRIRKLMKVHIPPLKDSSIDIVAIELQDSLFISEVSQNWIAVSIDDVDYSKVTDKSEYLVAGYPYRNFVAEENKLIPNSMFQLYTNSYSGSVDKGSDESDLFLKHGRNVTNAENNVIEIVDMQGVSGAPVWKLQERIEGVWAPIKNLKLAGVQSAFKTNSYIRAKKWSYVDELISIS